MDQQTVSKTQSAVVLEDHEEHTEGEGGDERRVLIEQGDIVTAVEEERGEKQGKGRARRAVVGLGVLGVLGVCLAVCVWLVGGKGATRKAKVLVNGSNSAAHAEADSDEAKTRRAIEEAGVVGPGATGPAVTMSDGSVVRPTVVVPGNGGASGGSSGTGENSANVPVTQFPPSKNEDLSRTVNSSKGTVEDEARPEKGELDQGIVKPGVRGRNTERSVRIGEDLNAPPRNTTVAREGSVEEVRKDVRAVTLPAYGSMLPVRSLGVLYTLRSGGLARFELTRDVKGKGWTMPRGTVLVGALRGAEYDRAYVSLVGFIDTESGSFVKVSGDLLGEDGGMGIRGKRKKMSSGWSRALSKLGEASLSIAGAFAGSIGRRPIVINDAFGSYQGRVTNELDGVLVGRDRNSFVEVAAGSSGYMMISELPDSVQGVDALSKLSARDMDERSDVDHPRRTTGISERELAELIESGDIDAIKLAMPRMTPEMRGIAERVINGDLAGR
ncbi:MAG TPA: hypothetical protein VFP64_10785 [Pyrinomonadaceae bacterium]|nr:hypothetical protein [Pyrinomonadaceae bacterium]